MISCFAQDCGVKLENVMSCNVYIMLNNYINTVKNEVHCHSLSIQLAQTRTPPLIFNTHIHVDSIFQQCHKKTQVTKCVQQQNMSLDRAGLMVDVKRTLSLGVESSVSQNVCIIYSLVQTVSKCLLQMSNIVVFGTNHKY